ncbi:PadR family transcriptional regulator [Martelella radicis]|uniref:DNA-binding PadR family transcriptional regulator n=1 Tax=Martelella radicis TaxID=1397476 RepID=A0A7W6PAP3_9HYPH|nr:PadR family transcriptional regulator [Martelella radicis]MBB4121839.1 DNA-binding PadR family transcriptional regulator [Martelella radicis]
MLGRFSGHGQDCGMRIAMARAPGRGQGRGPGRGHGGGGRGSGGDDGFGRIGRLLGHGRMRFLVLQLIAEEPRHGYDIIKAIEELSGGFYSPSPGVIYPTLSFLEDGGYVAVSADGNKKSYSITERGQAYLDEEAPEAEMAVTALKSVAERLGARERKRERARGGDNLPRSVEAAFLNMREVIDRRLEEDAGAAGSVVAELLALAERIEKAGGPHDDQSSSGED